MIDREHTALERRLYETLLTVQRVYFCRYSTDAALKDAEKRVLSCPGKVSSAGVDGYFQLIPEESALVGDGEGEDG